MVLFYKLQHSVRRLCWFFLLILAYCVPVTAAAATYEDQVQKMYVAYYGRPGDPGGLNWWAGKLEVAGGDLSEIIDSFGSSSEYVDRFGNMDNSALINNIFVQLLGRDADTEGLNWYLGKLESGDPDWTLASIALRIADGVQEGTDDNLVVANRMAVANAFTLAVENGEQSYDGDSDILSASQLLAGVDSDEATLTLALSAISGSAFSYYSDNVNQDIVVNMCSACHIEGGVAAVSNIVYPGDVEANYGVLRDYILLDEGNGAVILDKVRGVGHGGGVQLPSTTDGYQKLSIFIDLVNNCSDGCVSANKDGLFNGIVLASAEQTLRRAALIVAERLPTSDEITQAQSGDVGLRAALRGLMAGEGFHQFLISGADDRLFTETLWRNGSFDVIDAGADLYPIMANRENDLMREGDAEAYGFWRREFTVGFARAPLELIAYVVENDRPYTEILTADYTMVNRGSAEIVGASSLTFPEDGTYNTFKKAVNNGQVVRDEQYQASELEQLEIGSSIRVLSHSGTVNYPHAGILSEPAFLARYPTTETNRNRARSRWTNYHFLGFDIEKSAQRTTDPVALADTNNPTLNNPNCTVCHVEVDPVAGAFQHFGNEGWYNDSWFGLDSLPGAYKEDESSGYQEGDTWFRDMRSPGLGEQIAPATGSSIQWLAQHIVSDPRFATAAVKFWWPALMGAAPYNAPEVSSDVGFTEQLARFEQQQGDISTLGGTFVSGFDGGSAFNLKDLLVEMMMSAWFRGEGSTEVIDSSRAIELANVGVKRLLTPRELDEKTYQILGLRWEQGDQDPWEPDNTNTALSSRFGAYYGGIDGKGTLVRARQITPIMANIAEANALWMACGAIIKDINLPENERTLLQGIDRNMTPNSHESDIRAGLVGLHALMWGESVESNSSEVNQSYSLLTELWEYRVANDTNSWAWNGDIEFCSLPDGWWEDNEDNAGELADDPTKMLGTWIAMLVFFMTDFNFLHE